MAGLYLHIPFCEQKCIYCNFYSIESFDNKKRFLKALDLEIDMRADELEQKSSAPIEYKTLFFGGGTPSILSPDELDAILTKVRSRFRVTPDAEITMECNPGALTHEWLQGYRDIGINRLSFGVQSFHDDELSFLSRIHTAEQARSNISLVRETFENVSLDLIFALPHQTLERWRSNIQEAVQLGTDHISAYSLIFEEGTPLNTMRLQRKVTPADDSLEADMYEETVQFLGKHGLHQYEVSNYARPGKECRHNIGYWERRTYISFGPSAHSYLRTDNAGGIRWANVSSLKMYLDSIESAKLPVTSYESLSSQMVVEELLMLGLRSTGIAFDEFSAVTGTSLQKTAPDIIEKMLVNDYAFVTNNRLCLTDKGYIFADRFALELIHRIERELPELNAA